MPAWRSRQRHWPGAQAGHAGRGLRSRGLSRQDSGLSCRLAQGRQVFREARPMIGLFFEVTPREGHMSRYFELAAFLKPELERSGGVLFLDRYTSARRPELVLSHQWWVDEESLIRWREN